jgi:hypothetical protein
MELVIFIVLSALAFSFILAGAISKDRINLLPGSAILFILGLLLVTGTPLEIENGVEYQYKDVNGTQKVDTETTIYKEYQPPSPLDKDRFSQLLGLSILAISLYYFLISLSKLEFRSVMKRK